MAFNVRDSIFCFFFQEQCLTSRNTIYSHITIYCDRFFSQYCIGPFIDMFCVLILFLQLASPSVLCVQHQSDINVVLPSRH